MPGPGPTGVPVTPAPEPDNLRGVAFALLSVLGASLMSLGVRGAALELDSRMIVMFRAGITGLLIVIALVLFSSARRKLSFTRPGLHLLRGILIGVSTNLGFYTLTKIPLATATVLFFTAPIFATILGAMFQGDRIGPRRVAAIAAGFLGALIILRPGFGVFHPAMLTALASATLFSVALTLSRGLAIADGALSAYFSSVVLSVLVTLPLALPVWEIPSLPATWISLGVLILASAVRGVADIQAYRYGVAAVLAPVSYLRLVGIGFGAWLIFGERIDGYTWTGAVIIIAATLYIAKREATLRHVLR